MVVNLAAMGSAARDYAAPLQTLAVTGQSELEQPSGVLGLGNPGFYLAELLFGGRTPAPPPPTPAEEPAHLPDGEPGLPQQPDDGQATKDRRVVAATTVDPSGGAHQTGLLVEAKGGGTKSRPPGDFPD